MIFENVFNFHFPNIFIILITKSFATCGCWHPYFINEANIQFEISVHLYVRNGRRQTWFLACYLTFLFFGFLFQWTSIIWLTWSFGLSVRLEIHFFMFNDFVISFYLYHFIAYNFWDLIGLVALWVSS